jgi:REP element-mobilizing transposase RayT
MGGRLTKPIARVTLSEVVFLGEEGSFEEAVLPRSGELLFMQFQFFDREAEVEISERCLPHWEQAGATYFITFRTADSLPDAVIRAWRAERDNWLRRHHICPLARNLSELVDSLAAVERQEYHDHFSGRWQEMLDAGHGECVLKRPELSQIVADSLRYFDGDRYQLGDFVVMPNHVHLLVMFSGPGKLKLQCRSWKKFTAGRINEQLGRRGHFWQDESFDHLIRSPDQFEYFRRYIAENPAMARLRPGDYHWFRRQDDNEGVVS